MDRTRSRGEQFLVRWAIPQLHDIEALSNMVDSSLNGEYPAKSLSNFADIISQCVQVIFQCKLQLLSAFLRIVLQDFIFWSNVCIAVRARIQATYVRGCSIFTRYDKEGISQKWLK